MHIDRRFGPSLAEKLRLYVDIDPVTGCHNWVRALYATGYGMIAVGTAKHAKAHRVAYQLARGPIPEDRELDHLCRNRRCVNPDHLEPVTHAENGRRGESPFGINARKTHCPQGHPYDEPNTAWRDGKRHCRACDRVRSRIRYRQKREGALQAVSSA